MEKHTKKRFLIDRKDARRVDNIPGMAQLLIDIKPERANSYVYINHKMDLTNLEKWLKKKKKEGHDITYFHCFLTAIGKTIYQRRKLNWFIANHHIYEHDDISIAFTAKVSFEDHAEEMMTLVPIELGDNIYTISKKVRAKVDSYRNKKTNEIKKEGANNAIDVLAKLPNILRVPIVGLFKWCDDKGILPASLVEDNLYYSSTIVSNLGSIHCGAIHHNIANFGACSSLITMGEIKTEEVINEDGKKEQKKLCEFGINLDERIADGYYFSKSLKVIEEYFKNPELLEEEINEEIKNFEIR